MQLVVQTGNLAGQVVDLGSEWLLVGRDPGCNLVLDDEQVEAQHAAIGPQPDGSYAVRDLGSVSGTFVDGVRITEPTTLHGGEELRIGDTVLRVAATGEDAPPPRQTWKWLAIAVGAIAVAAVGAALAVLFIGGDEPSADKEIVEPTGTEVATATGELTVPPALTETVTITETVPSDPATTETEPATTEAPTDPATTEEPTEPATTEVPTEPATTEEPTTTDDDGDDGDEGGGADPEAELLSHVPADLRGSCQTQTDLEPEGAVASVVCSAPDGEARVVYWQFDDARSLKRWYTGYLTAVGAVPDTGDCVDDELAEERWTSDGSTAGRVLCAPVTDRNLRAIAWTHDALEIGSIAATNGLDESARERVYEFWLTAGPNP